MPYQKWDNFSLAIVVFFASRNAGHEGCSKILHFKSGGKGEPRSVQSIRGKLDGIRSIGGLWSGKEGWNIGAVDRWLVDLDVPSLRTILSCGLKEVSLIPLVITSEYISSGNKLMMLLGPSSSVPREHA